MANGAAYDDVEVLGIDERRDIALLKVRASDLPFVSLGKSSAVEIGDKIYSISNPLGFLQNTLSEGLISAVRQSNGYSQFQITAPVSQGSSGGPIFDHAGQVIAITVGNIPGGQNLNFGIPIDYARALMEAENPRPLASLSHGISGDATMPNPKEPSRDDQSGDATGSYAGRVCNTTAATCANFRLALHQAGSKLTGRMVVHFPLGGTGSIQGEIADSKIVFRSESYHALIGFTMRFSGTTVDGAFNGSYRVLSPSLQRGEFWTDRFTSDGPDSGADTGSCLKRLKSLRTR
jgi:hypothetical protein